MLVRVLQIGDSVKFVGPKHNKHLFTLAKTLHMMKSLLLAIACSACCLTASAQLATYTFGTTGNETAGASQTAPGISAGSFSATGVTSNYINNGTGRAFSTSGFSNSATVDDSRYLEVCIDLTTQLDNFTVTEVSLDIRRTGTGPSKLDVQYRFNGMTEAAATGISLTGTSFVASSFPMASVASTGQFCIRMLPYSASGSTGTSSIDNFVSHRHHGSPRLPRLL